MVDCLHDIEGMKWGIRNFLNLEDSEDPVNHPSHYASGGIECIEAIRASMTSLEFLGYLRGNCLKYLWRYDKKGNGKNKRLEDLNKALWYLNKLIEEYAKYIPECDERNTDADGSEC